MHLIDAEHDVMGHVNAVLEQTAGRADSSRSHIKHLQLDYQTLKCEAASRVTGNVATRTAATGRSHLEQCTVSMSLTL